MARTDSPARGTRLLAASVIVLAVLCVLTAGVLAKYVSTAQDTSATVSITQWSSSQAGQTFPVDVYVRAYVTSNKMAKDSAGGDVVDGTSTLASPTATDGSSWKALSGDPFCFYYVGTGGIVAGGQTTPQLTVTGDDYKIVYEYLEAGVTSATGNPTCQDAWGVKISDGSVSAA